MNELNDFLLNMFTCADKLRPALAVPNLKDGIVYASDGHVLIAIPEDELSLQYPTNEKYPKAENLLNKNVACCTKKTKVCISDIAKELVKARIEVDIDFINCKDCDGEGVVEWEYRSKSGCNHTREEECPVCQGEGGSDKEHPFARVNLSMVDENDGFRCGIHVGDLYFHPFHLYRLFMVALIHRVDVVEILSNPDEYGAAIVNIGKIKVLTMMMLKS